MLDLLSLLSERHVMAAVQLCMHVFAFDMCTQVWQGHQQQCPSHGWLHLDNWQPAFHNMHLSGMGELNDICPV